MNSERYNDHYRDLDLIEGREVKKLPSPEEVAAGMTPNGGWTRATLAQWGVPWPPPRGWRAELAKQYREMNQ